jgi:hypothetical protein
MGKPLNQAFTADQLAAAKADGGNGRATVDTSGDDVAHMRFRAVQEFSNCRQRQQPKIVQPIHELSSFPIAHAHRVRQAAFDEDAARTGHNSFRLRIKITILEIGAMPSNLPSHAFSAEADERGQGELQLPPARPASAFSPQSRQDRQGQPSPRRK